ncbi:TAXI family TRAP transporter solute-binding subunit [Streptomyces sp. enrichment culture]|uniref:TAXI family TRAP transporter solute-binding subunit n=1 Tax=Streptomyces sp. enrichment culture TaxID=1795815 RepID=UPI003F54C944
MVKLLSRIGGRRALQGAGAAFVALGLLLWWLLPLGEEPPSGSITFSTGTPQGVYQKYGSLLQQAFKRNMPDLEVRLQLSDGSQKNVARVATGTADFTIAAADAVETYREDGGPGAEQLRGVARLYDDYVHLVVPRDSQVESVEDLKGKRVAIGLPDSGVRLIATQVLQTAGIDPQTDITPLSDGIDTGPDGLRSGAIDAFFWSGGLPTDGITRLADDFALRFVPLDADFVAKLQSRGGATRYYRPTVMPESAYPAVQHGTPVPTMAVSNLLVTRADTDAELTEWLTRTVIRSRDRIGADVHSAQLVDLRTAIYTDPVPLHEGARRYYRSVKP